MYFSVPLSDSHSSESGSRLFAIRSRIYNSASPDLLSERTWAATHPQRYTKVYYRQLKSPPSEHRHIRQRSHSNRRPFTATCRTVCDLINNAERSTRSICPGAFPSPHREQPAAWRPAPCAPAENPATHVPRPARNPDAPASGTTAPRTSRAPDARQPRRSAAPATHTCRASPDYCDGCKTPSKAIPAPDSPRRGDKPGSGARSAPGNRPAASASKGRSPPCGRKNPRRNRPMPEILRPGSRKQRRSPKNIAGIVVLPFVPFDTLQNTTSAERIPQVVDETARSSGILEPRRLDERQQLGRYGSHGPIPIERFDERFDPSGRRFDIRIEQNEIVRIEILQRPVITSGEPVVTVQYDSPHSGKFAFEHAERIVRRTVVGHDDADPFGNRCEHRRQETAQMPGTVPIQDHYFCFRSHSMRARSAGDLCFHRLCDHIHRSGYSRIFCSRRRT